MDETGSLETVLRQVRPFLLDWVVWHARKLLCFSAWSMTFVSLLWLSGGIEVIFSISVIGVVFIAPVLKRRAGSVFCRGSTGWILLWLTRHLTHTLDRVSLLLGTQSSGSVHLPPSLHLLASS